MSDFNQAIPCVLQHEGSEFTDNPADPGGATKYGITLRYLADAVDAGWITGFVAPITIDTIRNLTLDQAHQVYQQGWWDKYHYGLLVNQQIATKTFDTAVNVGPVHAHMFLQSAYNSVTSGSLVVDGQLGPLSVGAINKLTPDQLTRVLAQYCNNQWAYYQRLIVDNSALEEFAHGWKNRAYSVC